MRSLKDCQALKEDGTPCTKRALPGKRYCYLHVGYKPPAVEPSKATDIGAEILRNSKLRIETLSIIDTLRSAIAQKMVQGGGVPPKDMAGLSSATNDAWGRPLYYESDGKGYAIASNGPDGRPGTEDDINFLSDEPPLCQAVLPSGKICGKPTEANGWYCRSHDTSRAKKKASDEKSRNAPRKETSGGGLRIVLDVLLLFLAAGGVVATVCWMSHGKFKRRK